MCMTFRGVFVAPAAPQSPETVDADLARMEGTAGIPHRHIKVQIWAPTAPQPLDGDAVFGVWFGSSSSSASCSACVFGVCLWLQQLLNLLNLLMILWGVFCGSSSSSIS